MKKELLNLIIRIGLLKDYLKKDDEVDQLERLYTLKEVAYFFYKIGDKELFSEIIEIANKHIKQNKRYIKEMSINDYD